MRKLGEQVWVADADQRFMGLAIGSRMTVVRLATGELWVCSPVTLSPELDQELSALGPVKYVIGPNRFHHLYLAPFCASRPQARLILAPGLKAKRSDLANAVTIDKDAEFGWGNELSYCLLEGVPMLNEVAFFHHPSRTLVLTDHLMHLGDQCPLATRLAGAVLGVRHHPSCPADVRWLLIRDRAALRRSIAQILRWDFERIIFAHGPVIEHKGRQVMEQAYAFL